MHKIKFLKYTANYVEIIESVVPEQDLQEVEVEQQTIDSAQDQHKAIALYDYSASEENEISFSDGDIITDIDFVSNEWWQGKAPDGAVGLFPGKKYMLHKFYQNQVFLFIFYLFIFS